jgi:hypothetical protein
LILHFHLKKELVVMRSKVIFGFLLINALIEEFLNLLYLSSHLEVAVSSILQISKQQLRFKQLNKFYISK